MKFEAKLKTFIVLGFAMIIWGMIRDFNLVRQVSLALSGVEMIGWFLGAVFDGGVLLVSIMVSRELLSYVKLRSEKV